MVMTPLEITTNQKQLERALSRAPSCQQMRCSQSIGPWYYALKSEVPSVDTLTSGRAARQQMALADCVFCRLRFQYGLQPRTANTRADTPSLRLGSGHPLKG